MRKTLLGSLFVLAAAAAITGQDAKPAATPAPPATVAALVDSQVSAAEKAVIEAAEAMPEDRFGFSPESLNLPGAAYKGVRTFALQVRHIAASNYALWAPVTGDKVPDDWRGGNGPESLKTKEQILKFLRDSYALGHRAAATLTAENLLQYPEGATSSRLFRTTRAVSHAYDHYGQMVEYLRMNGIVPPASRPKGD
jgi:hypothetical protein